MVLASLLAIVALLAWNCSYVAIAHIDETASSNGRSRVSARPFGDTMRELKDGSIVEDDSRTLESKEEVWKLRKLHESETEAAEEEEIVIEGMEGKEEHEGEGAHEEGHEGEEEELRDLVGACMLLGGICFVFFLLYIVHHHDEDVRRHSWNVLSRTISIFVSVLLFVGLNGLIDGFRETHLDEMSISQELKEAIIITLAYLQFFMFHFTMHVIMASYSFKKVPEGKSKEEVDEFKGEQSLNMNTWSTLTAHMCGFALMRCTGLLQQLDLFRSSPWLALIPVCFNAFLLMFVFRFADVIRSSSLFTSHEVQDKINLWDRASEEAENDVAQLSISFSIAVVLRYAISGHLPSAYGLVLPVQEHGYSQAATIMLAGLLFIALEFLIVFLRASFQNANSYGQLNFEYEAHPGLDPLNVYFRRWVHIAISVCAVTFAWCFMYATKWALHTLILSFGYTSLPNSCVQLVVQSLVISFTAFGGIRSLDSLADMKCTGRQVDMVLEEIMKAVGILVGFSWETSFDAGVEVISELTSYPTMSKMGIAIFIAIVMVPSWGRHILKKASELNQAHVEQEAEQQEAFEKDARSDKCPKCGAPVTKTMHFCGQCGTQLTLP